MDEIEADIVSLKLYAIVFGSQYLWDKNAKFQERLNQYKFVKDAKFQERKFQTPWESPGAPWENNQSATRAQENSDKRQVEYSLIIIGVHLGVIVQNKPGNILFWVGECSQEHSHNAYVQSTIWE